MPAIQDEIDLMNKPFVMGDDINTDPPAPATDPPAPITDAPDDFKTDAPTTDAPSNETIPPKTDAPATDAPTTDAPDERDQTIAELRNKLAEKDIKTNAPTTTAPLVFETHDFLKDIDIEEITSKPEDFNKLLNAIYQKAVTDTQKRVDVNISQTVPNMINMASSLKKATESFYDNNGDLKPFKKVVAHVFDEIVNNNPNKPYADVMEEVAPEVRKRLELPAYVKKTVNKRKPPRLPNKRGKSGKAEAKPKANTLENDINSMNEVLRG